MDNFVRIAAGLDVAPALAELARQPEELWLQLGADALRSIALIGGMGGRRLEAELPECWRLIDHVLAIAAAEHGDEGRLSHCRIGLMPPGCGLAPHFDGVDGIFERRYQLALVSEPGVALTVGGETKRPRPGEAWQIDASRTHSVHNGSSADRITILFDTCR
ncbi:MAG: aspartyl/asparaginyl beta-hydroxylase domain-containing protein [Sphingomonadaceae bacterium]|nr:aspartyl/asparaginyl beta-hydroxylase domain-containing protein [Sphingomonadaceae bacterium]